MRFVPQVAGPYTVRLNAAQFNGSVEPFGLAVSQILDSETAAITGPDPTGEGTTEVNSFTAVDRGSYGGTGESATTDFRLEAGKSCSITHRTELAFREDLPASPSLFVVSASNQDRRFTIAAVGLWLVAIALLAAVVVAIWDYRTAKPDAY